ncbi:MAG: S41 family peptidase [Planctomycetota bacterium]
MFSHRASSCVLGLLAAVMTFMPFTDVARAEVRPHAGMLRYPDVSATHIVFVYANDIWIAPRAGGLAAPLANPAGVESFPRFSADGQTIAFVGNYDGNTDLYTIPMAGGIPIRVTHHPTGEHLCDWSPDGQLIFQAAGLAGINTLQLFTVDPAGGLPQQLPVPYGGNGAISPDGTWLAYTPEVRDSRTWKRYRGGRAADVWLFNLTNNISKQITEWEGTDSQPMWFGDRIYYLSDAGPAHRLNIWEYNTRTGRQRQITKFTEYDIKWPSIGPGGQGKGEIVFQCGSKLYLLDLSAEKSHLVEIIIPGDRPTIRPQRVDVSSSLQSSDVSATGKRAVLEARGDIWTLPAKEGVPYNLTHTGGIAERNPVWSPDGRWVAYFSDADDEYDLYVTQSDGKGETRKVATLGPGWRYMRGWSPDSKYIAFVEKSGAMYICEMETGELTEVDVEPSGGEPPMRWSHDSRWIVYTRSADNLQSSIWVYEVESGEKHQLTSGMFHDSSPTFDRQGDYLYFVSSRNFNSPIYEDVGKSFVYTGTQVLIAIPLRADLDYPWTPDNDQETWDDEQGEDDEDGDKEKDKKSKKDRKEDAEPEEEDQDENGDEDNNDKAVEDDGVSGTWEGTLSGDEPLPPTGLPFTMILRLAPDGAVSGSIDAGPYAGHLSDGTFDRQTGELTASLEVTTDEGIETFGLTARITDESIEGSVTGEGFSATFKGTRTSTDTSGLEEEDEEDEEKEDKQVQIDIEGFEQRALQLPVEQGRIYSLAVNNKNQLIFAHAGLRGSGKPTEIKLFDITDDKKEVKTVVSGAGSFDITADGKKLMVRTGRSFAIIDAKPGQKLSQKVPMDGMTSVIEPRAEWQQLFNDVWRIERDFFYVENMHGVDWPAARKQYARMLDDCISREDVAYVMAEMISELNIGHAYYRSGPGDRGPSVSVGMLGVDFELHEGAYRLARIRQGAPWDLDARGPLSQPGVDVKEGDYLLAVNGIPLDTSKDPWAAFIGLAGKVTTLTVSEKPTLDDDAREIIVKPLNSENGLRYRSWVEDNRRYVEQQTAGRVGYIHVPDTSINGQNNLFRQFYGQRDKDALIIDERWNGGGQIPTRFIELLNRPLLNYWAVRDGRDNRTPPDAHYGPKCMLINGSAGSGGDMFPALFRQTGLGKLIGRRTWGGLVGMSGQPRLIDGAAVTVPTFGYYELDGTWGIEGHGVDPDITVIDDPALMTAGGDPQLDTAIKHMLEEIKRHPRVPAIRPADPDRSGMGIQETDK